MIPTRAVRTVAGLLVLGPLTLGHAGAALAQDASAGKAAAPFGAIGGAGKEPIKIDADRLDVFDRENRAVFAGNVVAVQGDSTIRCSSMTVRYKRDRKGEEAKAGMTAEAAPEDKARSAAEDKAKSAAAMGANGIQRVECAGPVTVVQKDQVASGDNAVFDQANKRIVLSGNVVLSQCQNVTRGSRLVYDMATGRANMDPVAGGRVSAMFVAGDKGEAKGGTKGCAQPALAAKPAPKPAAPTRSAPQKPAEAARARAQAN